MPRGKKYRAEEIIPKLREAEILISQGSAQELAAKNIGVSVQTLTKEKSRCQRLTTTLKNRGDKI